MLSLLLTIFLFGFASAANGQSGPAIWLCESKLTYPTKAHSIAGATFYEMTVWVDSKPFRLHNGLYNKKYKPYGSDQLSLAGTWFINNIHGIPTHAVILLERHSTGGSSSMTDYIQVLTFEKHSLKVVQEFRFIPLAIEGRETVEFDPSTGQITVVARSAGDSSDCCPRSVDIARYSWSGSQFSLLDWHSAPYKQHQ